jgi:hypothetical protein
VATLPFEAVFLSTFGGIALLIIGVWAQLVAEQRPRALTPLGWAAVATVPAVWVYLVLHLGGPGFSLAMIWALLLAPWPAAGVLMLLPVRGRRPGDP